MMMLVMTMVVLVAKIMVVVMVVVVMVVVQLAPSDRGWSPKAAAVPFEKRRSPSGD